MDNKVRTNRVDWDHWLNMPSVKLWEAVSLSMNSDPLHERYIHNFVLSQRLGEGVLNEDGEKFKKRLILLQAHFFDTEHLSIVSVNGSENINSEIHLESFADWALNIVHWDIPEELKSLVDPEDLPEETKQEEVEPEETELEETEMDSIMNASDFDHITKQGIINLFDKVTKEEWDKLFKNAYRTGLKETKKEGSNKYNPFLVGAWLFNNNGKYTCPQIERKLANCLKPESKYKKDLITDLRTTDFE
jgi:hypothetical protein